MHYVETARWRRLANTTDRLVRGCDAGSRYNYRGGLFAFQRAKKVGGTAVGNNQWKVEDFAVVKVLLKKVTTITTTTTTNVK